MGSLHIIWITLLLYAISTIYLFLYCEDENTEIVAQKKVIGLYAGSMLLIIVGMSIYLCIMYPENSLLFNMKRTGLTALLTTAAFIDYKSYKIPNKLILIGMLLRISILGMELLTDGTEIKWTLISEIVAAAGLFSAAMLCRVCIKNSIGFGDIKLFLIMGLFLGVNSTMNAMFLTLVISFVIAVIVLICRKKGRKDMIPFAPAILLGTVISIYLTGM